jgi:hypothetical protein
MWVTAVPTNGIEEITPAAAAVIGLGVDDVVREPSSRSNGH